AVRGDRPRTESPAGARFCCRDSASASALAEDEELAILPPVDGGAACVELTIFVIELDHLDRAAELAPAQLQELVERDDAIVAGAAAGAGRVTQEQMRSEHARQEHEIAEGLRRFLPGAERRQIALGWIQTCGHAAGATQKTRHAIFGQRFEHV